MQFKKVINTLNWDMTVYKKDFYSVKLNRTDDFSICLTPDHQLWTDNGFKAVKDIDPNKDKLAKLVQNCIFCKKKINLTAPKLFCTIECRDNFLAKVPEHIDKLSDLKYEMEYFYPKNLIHRHKQNEGSFLHDITVADDESFSYHGLITKNCRCLISTVYSGFGFKNGGLEYIGKDHDEYEHQRAYRKSMTNEFVNHDCSDHIIK